MDNIKILVVDDHPLLRDGLKISLTSEDDLQVIGEASNGAEALELLETLTPDIILMDLLMPEMDGLEAIEQIVQSNPEAKVLVLSGMEDDERVLSAIQAGALGYFPKTAPRKFLLEAIHKVADGVPYMPSGITLKLFQGLRRTKTVPSHEQVILTPRQQEILALLSEGKSDDEIGRILHLQESTVRAHVHHILRRLGLGTRAQAVAYANKSLKDE
jgi:DNA-binding NarL/FixJ family response regulator